MHYLLLVAVVGLEMSPGLSFVDARDRSAIVSAIAYSVYDLLGEKVSVYVKETVQHHQYIGLSPSSQNSCC